MTDIQMSRYDALLRRVADLKGPGSKVNDVLEELFPTLDVENVPVELLRLSGTSIGQAGGGLAAVVAEVGRAQIFNPVGSGKLVVITKAYFSADGTTTARWGVTTTVLPVAVSAHQFRDTRDLAPNLPTAQYRQQSSASFANATMQSRIIADTVLEISDPNGVAVLAPGSGWEVGANTLDILTNYAIYWRERVAEPSELNL